LKFKLDENMPVDFKSWLQHHGHDATDVIDEGLIGTQDPPLLAEATKEKRILLTFDLDFADIRRYPPGTHTGIVVFRLREQRWTTLEKPANSLIASNALKSLGSGLAIVDETRIRWKRVNKQDTP
jgi:predicted nuclease of predicted toxin-antitoxin system